MNYNSSNTLVSIILPTYNWKKEWLEESINSVLNQSYINFELIIINDASTNNIEDIILKFIKKDLRIRYIKNEKNLRLTKTLNKWIDLSKWKYIARIDDDDIWYDKDKLKKQVEFMEKNPDYWLCWCSSIFIDSNWNDFWIFKAQKENLNIKKKLLNENQFLHSNIIFNKDIIKDIWKYIDNDSTKYCEDYEFWLRIWTKYKLHNLNDIYTKIRVSDIWISITNKNLQTFNAFKLALKYRKYYNWKLFFIIWINRIIILKISYFTKEIWIYDFLSYKWRKYILKQKI